MARPDLPEDRPQVVERRQTEFGELVLRRCGEHYELVSDGMFLMDTRDGRSERALIDEVLAVAEPRPRVVIGGLGFGFSLAAAVASDVPASIDVVEIHQQVIEWNWTYLPERTANAAADPRVRIVHGDLASFLDRWEEPVDVVCVDTDNGPDWLCRQENAAIYRSPELAGRLGQRGVFAVWSAQRSASFEDALRRGFDHFTIHEIPVARGVPDVVYIARCPRLGQR